MKKVVCQIITVFLYFNVVAPVFTYYIQGDNANAGYVAAVGSNGPYKNRMNSHKKYFIGSNNPKYTKLVNEQAIDSHFTVLKTPPKPFVSNNNEHRIENTQVHRSNVNIRQRIETRDNSHPKYEEQEKVTSNEDITVDKHQDKEKTTPLDEEAYGSFAKKHNQRENLINSNNVYEKKANFIAINQNKAQLPKEQKVINIKSNNQQAAPQAQKYQQKIPGSGKKDTIIHKASTTNERNTKSMLQNANEMAQNKLNLDLQKIESKKRDTLNNQPVIPEITSNNIYDSVRRYKSNYINNYNEKNKMVSYRIGNHEEIVVNNTPYALFYRMNPEHLDEQEVMVENPLVEPSRAINDKMSWNYEVQNMSEKAKLRGEPYFKLHRKVKNHLSYRNR